MKTKTRETPPANHTQSAEGISLPKGTLSNESQQIGCPPQGSVVSGNALRYPWKALAIVFALTIGTRLADAAPFNNGGFELPVVTGRQHVAMPGWDISKAPTCHLYSGGYIGLNPIEGNQHLAISHENGALGETVSQAFDTTAGTRYEVRFSAGWTGNPSSRDMQVLTTIESSTGELLTSTNVNLPGKATWGTTTFTFVARTPMSTLTFKDSSSVASETAIFLDDIRVVEKVAEPNRAEATAFVNDGFVTRIVVTYGGYGYSEPPLVLISGGGGSGASATAAVSDGMVTGIDVVNPGRGYTSLPSVRVASPPFSPELEIEVRSVNVKLRVQLGRKYQLQISDDLSAWSLAGSTFVADSESIVREFNVTEGGRFFRIVEVP